MITTFETDLFTLTRGKRTVEVTLHYGGTDDLIHMLKPGTEIKIPERVVKVPGDATAAPDALPPAKPARKPRATKADKAPKAPRAGKADEATIAALLANIAAMPVKAADWYTAAGVDKRTGDKARALLVADGRVVQHGAAKGTTYTIGAGVSA